MMKGLELSERFYHEAVRPVFLSCLPDVRHSAGLMGYGSEVIGFDDVRSRDHMWGPRCVIFLPVDNFDDNRRILDGALRASLPLSFYGFPTGFGPPDEEGVRLLAPVEDGPVDHLVQIVTVPGYFDAELGWDTSLPPTVPEWLTFSEHKLLTLTRGGVWHDQLGVDKVRDQLDYYPDDVWLYLLACQWMKIGQEEPFVGRTVEAGDHPGSRILAARMVEAVMGLGFLMERSYAPYSKWFGSAFSRLKIAPEILPDLEGALDANQIADRENHLCNAYEICAAHFNRLKLIPPVEARVSKFHDRPFRVIHGDWIAKQIFQIVENETLKSQAGFIGSVNQLSASTDVLSNVGVCKRLRGLYG